MDDVDAAVAQLLGCLEGRLRLHPSIEYGSIVGWLKLAGGAASQLVIEPVMRELDGAKSLLILSAEILSMVPFDIIPLLGGVLADHYDVRQIASVISTKEMPRSCGAERYLLVGDIDYGRVTCGRCHEAGGVAVTDATTSHGELPGSLEEINTLRPMIESAGKTCVVLRGSEVCRHVAVREFGSHDVLHIATHGGLSLSERADGAAFGSQNAVVSRHELAPFDAIRLQLSGAQAFKGAHPSGGALTGFEVMNEIDMRRVELCVLSACDQSVGVRAEAVIVASMQMAISVAGCKAVLAMAYTAPDLEVPQFMARVYENYLWMDTDPATALWHAKLFYLRSGNGLPAAVWAGWFVLFRGIPSNFRTC
jgi:CHAT domain-containing protein